MTIDAKLPRECDTAQQWHYAGWRWLKTPWYCPSCGQRDMWQASDDGPDYYHDCSATCHSCDHTMCCVKKEG